MQNGDAPSSVEVAAQVVDSFMAAGGRDVAYCPGSRNAPFAYALAGAEKNSNIRVHPFADERSASFWALGAAKGAGGRAPVAVVTTSGTAVAELHAALQEARHQGLPVVAITADRPFEMVEVGASQTTTQEGMLDSATVASLNIPVGTGVSGLTNRVDRTLARSLGFGGTPGPVHINVALRDPLTPADMAELDTSPPLGARRHTEHDYVARIALEQIWQPPAQLEWEKVVERAAKTVVVAGDVEARAQDTARQVALEAAARGIPILAEPSSGLTDASTWIPHSTWLAPHFYDDVEQIVVVGKPTLSRAITALVSKPNIRKIIVSDYPQWPDLNGTASMVIPGFTPSQESRIEPLTAQENAWLDRWREAATRVDEVLRRHRDRGELDYVTAAELIWRGSDYVDLWLGASNSIRAFDLVATWPGNPNVFSSRGLAGIDGTIATALGFQNVRKRPIRVVLGDLTFCYDLSTLPARPTEGADIQLIVLDDEGGSIFASLEHGAAPQWVYDKYFAVKQRMDVVALARATGWEGKVIDSVSDLEQAIAKPPRGRSVLHARLNRPAELFNRLRTAILMTGNAKGKNQREKHERA